jgi:hypothetical protein
MGRQGRWEEAAADAARSIEHQPAEHYHYHMLAPLLVVTGNRPAYDQLCRKIMATFPTSINPYGAQRMATDCLLLPGPDVDLSWADELAEIAVSRGSGETGTLPYFQACKALSSYRLARYPDAVSWAEKALGGSPPYARAHAFAVLSMANWQLGRQAEARAMLMEGEALAPHMTPERNTEKFGGSWVAWLVARIALDEAKTLIQPERPEERVQRP